MRARSRVLRRRDGSSVRLGLFHANPEKYQNASKPRYPRNRGEFLAAKYTSAAALLFNEKVTLPIGRDRSTVPFLQEKGQRGNLPYKLTQTNEENQSIWQSGLRTDSLGRTHER